MELNEEHIGRIRSEFAKMKTKEDLLKLLNKVKPFVFGSNAVPFELKQLTWYGNPNLGGRRYRTFVIKKKSGADRKIHAPVRGLRALQQVLGLILQCVFKPQAGVTGFVRGRSILDNAQFHTNQRYVFNIDLKDFFTSIEQARVWKCLQLTPFFLVDKIPGKTVFLPLEKFRKLKLKQKEKFTFLTDENGVYIETLKGVIRADSDFDVNKEKFIYKRAGTKGRDSFDAYVITNHDPSTKRILLANIIAGICCTVMVVNTLDENGVSQKVKRNVLPQGAPTSPILSNIVCQRLDHILLGVAKRFGLKYSRYADDITFSSMHNVYQEDSEFCKELNRVISEQGFEINSLKTRIQKDSYRQEVTGLLVNERVNLHKQYIKQIRMLLYYWERYGYEKAERFFTLQYIKENANRKIPSLSNVLSGKLDYFKMVKGGSSSYKKLKKRFDDLLIKDKVASSKEKLTQNAQQHNPKHLVELLSKFSEDRNPLKFTKHSWDYGMIEGLYDNYKDFIKQYNEKGRPICFEIQSVKRELGAKILHFTNTKSENGKYIDSNGIKKDFKWGEYQLSLGWKSRELAQWAKANPTKDPFDFPVTPPVKIEKYGRSLELTQFGDIVNVFANEIEVRSEGDQLEAIMIEMRKKHLKFDFKKPNYVNLKGVQFYTDVDYFKRALNKVFDSVSKRTQFPQIEIAAANQKKGTITISITQYESYSLRKSSDDMINEVQDGDFSDIRKYLINLCDWSVESIFSDGSYQINYLTSSEVPVKQLLTDVPLGFTHKFTFYIS
ncbi:MAG TPA: reverse transcriptase domain-containing protein [Flavipsychrobacter sp.]|nr:reverse transcriptase domain-containing protein [Flavipsychrobacter sp.]